VLAALASAKPDKFQVKVYTTKVLKAERWREASKQGSLQVSMGPVDDDKIIARSTVLQISSDAEQVARNCDMLILAVPAFAHASYMKALKPYLPDGVVVVGLPGQTGFEFEVNSIFRDKFPVVMNFDSSPWSCRIVEFGKKVSVLGAKARIVGALQGNVKSARVANPFDAITELVGYWTDVIPSDSLLAISLVSPNACSHPPIMYEKWRRWSGHPLSESPLFYQTIDDSCANLVTGLSEEVLDIRRSIICAYPEQNLSQVIPILEWDRTRYGHMIEDDSSQRTAICTNRAYVNLRHPMKVVPGGYVPDFTQRYLEEDVPFGLVVIRGIAALAGVRTPLIDKVLYWCQEKLGKQYLLNGCMKGKDIASSRAPQRFGYDSLESIL